MKTSKLVVLSMILILAFAGFYFQGCATRNPEGSLSWEYQIDGTAAYIATDENEIYVMSRIENSGNGYYDKGHLYCFDSENKNLVWKRDIPCGWLTPVNDRLLVNASKYLICLSVDKGDIIWKQDLSEGSSPITISNGKVYVASKYRPVKGWFSEKVNCFDIVSGDLIWQYDLKNDRNSTRSILSSPIVAEEQLYITSENLTNSSLYCFNPASGKLLWQTKLGWGEGFICINNERLYLPSGGLSCLNAKNGKLLWQKDLGTWNNSHLPVVFENKVYAIAESLNGEYTGYVYCFNAENGQSLWTYKPDSPKVPQFDIYTDGGSITTVPLFGNENVYFGASDHCLYCLDAIGGNFLWKFEGEELINTIPQMDNGNVYFASGKYLHAVNSVTGKLIWKFDAESTISAISIIYNGSIFIVSSGGYVYSINLVNK
jgi:outer membrane protein assembly factor BamB